MRDLFQIDLQDYTPGGSVFRRPSVRAVIVREGKVLLVHSKKYDYYKFPGGGIRDGETHVQALTRELQEETGYRILPETVEEFGRVVRRQKDTYGAFDVFEQENFYYFCEVEETPGEVSLDAYEKEEGFTAVWMDPFLAARHNQYRKHSGGDRMMISREGTVLDLVDREIAKRERAERERRAVAALGEQDYADMLAFVKEKLEGSTSEKPGMRYAKDSIAYSRFEHTKRVLGWTKRLYERAEKKEVLRYEDLLIATIFHDVGRSVSGELSLPHAKAGVPITREYLLEKDFVPERVEYICSLVGGHSDKHRMQEPDTDPNLLLLMEADLLDDTGMLGIVMDCMVTQARVPEAQFSDCLDHILRYTYRLQKDNPMVTPAARAFWAEKTKLVNTVVAELKQDLELSYEKGSME